MSGATNFLVVCHEELNFLVVCHEELITWQCVTKRDGRINDLRKSGHMENEKVHGKFTAMLWNTGIHSMANGGRKLCENDQDKFINNCDLRNDDDMTI